MLSKLKNHIKIYHRGKSNLPCTVCKLHFRNLDEVARHTSMAHKTSPTTTVNCNQCGQGFNDKKEIITYINKDHTTHKPCKKFGLNKCDMSPCQFNHIIIQSIEEICFKCGLKFSFKTDIITHIKKTAMATQCAINSYKMCVNAVVKTAYLVTKVHQSKGGILAIFQSIPYTVQYCTKCPRSSSTPNRANNTNPRTHNSNYSSNSLPSNCRPDKTVQPIRKELVFNYSSLKLTEPILVWKEQR